MYKECDCNEPIQEYEWACRNCRNAYHPVVRQILDNEEQ